MVEKYNWKKWITFEWSDPLIEEILGSDFDISISHGETQQLAEDFVTLKNRFMNLVAMHEGTENVCDELLDKIYNYSDEELLSWRKARSDKIRADRKVLEKVWNEAKPN